MMASNFRWSKSPSAVWTSGHISGDIASWRIDSLSCSIVAASFETSSTPPTVSEGAGAAAFALLMPINLLAAGIQVRSVDAKA
jgi:hypothetical protein